MHIIARCLPTRFFVTKANVAQIPLLCLSVRPVFCCPSNLFTLNSDLHLIIASGNNTSQMAGTLPLLVICLTVVAIFNEQSKMTAVAPNPFENVILRVLSKPVGI